MRIVLCTNQLPCDEPGGVGLFSANLAGALVRAGHEIWLVGGASRRPRAPGAGADVQVRDGGCWIERTDPAAPGVHTLRLLRADDARTGLGRFVGSFTHRRTEAVLERWLRQLRPDVVHVQHTLNLTARLSSVARGVGAAVVATVHDYWPICHRIDLRQPDGGPCPGPAGGLRCAGCLQPLKRSGGRALNLWDGWQYLRRSGERSVEVGVRVAPYLLRTQLVQGGYALAHRITYPGPDVADLLQRAGFPVERVALVDYGVPPLPQEVARARGRTARSASGTWAPSRPTRGRGCCCVPPSR